MSIDMDAIRKRHAEMQRHYDGQDEGEFSMAGSEALDDVPELLAEIGRLQALLADEQGSHAMTASSFEIFAESAAESRRQFETKTAELRRSAIEHAKRHREIFDAHLRQVAELTDERDEARAEVVRLGKAMEASR